MPAIYKKYYVELERICFEKNYNAELKQLLKKWLFELIIYYNPNLDIFNQVSLEEYIKKKLQILEKVRHLTLFNVEEVLKDKSNYFYNQIEQASVYPIKNNKKNFLLKKIKNKYVIDSNGDYFFDCIGACWCLGYEIQLLKEKEEELTVTFHHELTHLEQDLVGFYYPSIYPYSTNMRKMFREGNAVYHERLFKGQIHSPFVFWDALHIQNYKYEFYYQIYMLLSISLPKNMFDSFCQGKFNVAYLPESQKDFFSEIFSLATILLIKSIPENNLKTIKDSLNCSYQDCLLKLESYSSYKSEIEQEKKYQKQLIKMKEILQNPKLLEKEYLREYKEAKERIFKEASLETQKKLLFELEQNATVEEYEKLLKHQIYSTKKSIEAYQKKINESEFVEEYKHKNYQFGISLYQIIQKYLEKDLSINDIFQDLVKKVETFLIQEKSEEIKILFVQSIKAVSYEDEMNIKY